MRGKEGGSNEWVMKEVEKLEIIILEFCNVDQVDEFELGEW